MIQWNNFGRCYRSITSEASENNASMCPCSVTEDMVTSSWLSYSTLSSTFVFNPYYLFNCLLSYRIPQVYLTDFVQWLLLFSRFCFRGKFVFGFEAFSDVLCLVRLGSRLLIFALTFLMIMDLLLEIYFCFCFWLLLVKP